MGNSPSPVPAAVNVPPGRAALSAVLVGLLAVLALAGCDLASNAPSREEAISPVGTASAPGTSGGTGTATARGSGRATNSPASRSAGPSRSPAGSTGATKAPPPSPPTLRAVPGYVYTAPNKDVAKGFSALAARYPGVLSAPVVRTVTRNKVALGAVAAMAFGPEYAAVPEAESGLVQALVKGISGKGYKTSNRLVGAVTVVTAVKSDSTILAWYDRGVVVLVVSPLPVKEPFAFAQAYLAVR